MSESVNAKKKGAGSATAKRQGPIPDSERGVRVMRDALLAELNAAGKMPDNIDIADWAPPSSQGGDGHTGPSAGGA